LKADLQNIDLKIQFLIATLNRLEQIWFEILLPEMEEAIHEESIFIEKIAKKEFDDSYSYERAETDPNYDARRIHVEEADFYATLTSLERANQQTINALYISLGAFMDHCFIEIIHDAGCSEFIFGKIEETEYRLKEMGIYYEVETYEKTKEIRHLVNYLKHGKGNSAKNIALIIQQFSSTISATPLLDMPLPAAYLKESIANLRLFLEQLADTNNQFTKAK
jgi:hypothetical protein